MHPILDPIWETVFAVATWSVMAVVAISLVMPWIRRKVAYASKQHTATNDETAGLAISLGQFLIKTVIVSAAILVLAWIVLDRLDNFATRRTQQLERIIRSATAIGGRQFWTKLEGELGNLADPRMDIPPEKKAKILSQIRAISDRWRPFLAEAASAIEGDAQKLQK
jgi:hypothetical protein